MASVDTTSLRRITTAVVAAAVMVAMMILFARCSEPSTLQIGDADAAPNAAADAVNASTAGLAALRGWAPGSDPVLTEAEWRTPGGELRVVADVDGHPVQVIAARTPEGGWTVPYPPRPAAEGGGETRWDRLPPPTEAAGSDLRWKAAAGFLDAWLRGDDTSRWTSTSYTAPELPVAYPDYQITGTTPRPLSVSGTAVAVVPVEYETPSSPGQVWRVYLAVAEDAAGRWAVVAVPHGPPPPGSDDAGE